MAELRMGMLMRAFQQGLAVWIFVLVLPCAAALETDGLVIPFRKVAVSSPVQGMIASLPVQEGDRVEQGALLARLQDEEEQLERARLSLVLEKRQFDADATARLLKDNLISADEAMEKRIELAIVQLQVSSAELALTRKQITAPLSGVVVSRKREAGEWVNPGEVLFEIVLMDPVYVELLLDGREGIRLRRGETVTVQVPDLDDELVRTAVIDFIDPRMDASSGLMKVRLLLDNADELMLPGMRTRVNLAPVHEAATVPMP